MSGRGLYCRHSIPGFLLQISNAGLEPFYLFVFRLSCSIRRSQFIRHNAEYFSFSRLTLSSRRLTSPCSAALSAAATPCSHCTSVSSSTMRPRAVSSSASSSSRARCFAASSRAPPPPTSGLVTSPSSSSSALSWCGRPPLRRSASSTLSSVIRLFLRRYLYSASRR